MAHTELGTEFDDEPILQSVALSEDSRVSRIDFCATQRLPLTGLKAFLDTGEALTPVGNTDSCTVFELGSDELIEKITLYFDQTAIRGILTQTNQRENFAGGANAVNLQSAEMKFSPNEPLLGFWDSEGANLIYSLGAIKNDITCYVEDTEPEQQATNPE